MLRSLLTITACDQCSDLEAIDACQNRDEVKRRGLKMALGPYRRCVSVPGVANGACANCVHFSKQDSVRWVRCYIIPPSPPRIVLIV